MTKHFLVADIGGTNTNFAVYTNKLDLLTLYHCKTKDLKDTKNISKIIKEKVIKNYKISAICLGCAGPIDYKKSKVTFTNHDLTIEGNKLARFLQAKKLFLLNDFEALGYGVNKFIYKKNHHKIVILNPGKPVKNKTIALIGAGTGLGKAILVYDRTSKFYFPINSEGGHADFNVENYFELQLADYIKKQLKLHTLVYEDVVSGKGIVHIYYFLYSKYRYIIKDEQLKIKKEIDCSDDKAAVISNYRQTDFLCKETFKLFSKYYAISIRNFALETLAVSGIYIAGGIGLKNKDIFDKQFFENFTKHDTYKQLLENIPLYLIEDPTTSLFGCALYIAVFKK